jgi:hypothetical protein
MLGAEAAIHLAVGCVRPYPKPESSAVLCAGGCMHRAWQRTGRLPHTGPRRRAEHIGGIHGWFHATRVQLGLRGALVQPAVDMMCNPDMPDCKETGTFSDATSAWLQVFLAPVLVLLTKLAVPLSDRTVRRHRTASRRPV